MRKLKILNYIIMFFSLAIVFMGIQKNIALSCVLGSILYLFAILDNRLIKKGDKFKFDKKEILIGIVFLLIGYLVPLK